LPVPIRLSHQSLISTILCGTLLLMSARTRPMGTLKILVGRYGYCQSSGLPLADACLEGQQSDFGYFRLPSRRRRCVLARLAAWRARLSSRRSPLDFALVSAKARAVAGQGRLCRSRAGTHSPRQESPLLCYSARVPFLYVVLRIFPGSSCLFRQFRE
jgi:hypothetical protein